MAMSALTVYGNKSIAENRFRPTDQVLDELDQRPEKDFSCCLIRQ
jgi:hypothetical protein